MILSEQIEKFEKDVRARGGDPVAIYKAAGIQDSEHLQKKFATQFEKLAAISYAVGRLDSGRPGEQAPMATTRAPTAPAKSKRQQYEELHATDYVAAAKFYRENEDAILSNAPAGAVASADVSAIKELSHLVSLTESKKTAEAKAYIHAHRAILILQRDACMALLHEQLEAEKDNTKKHKLVNLVRQLRDLPL